MWSGGQAHGRDLGMRRGMCVPSSAGPTSVRLNDIVLLWHGLPAQPGDPLCHRHQVCGTEVGTGFRGCLGSGRPETGA